MSQYPIHKTTLYFNCVIVSIIIIIIIIIKYKDYAFLHVPIPRLDELILPSLRWFTSLLL
jgi:hypothetical protein